MSIKVSVGANSIENDPDDDDAPEAAESAVPLPPPVNDWNDMVVRVTVGSGAVVAQTEERGGDGGG